jgi:hypothetical protein
MATIPLNRLTRAIPLKAAPWPRVTLRDAVSRLIYGRLVVDCEECGARLSPHKAVWRGLLRPYCSIEHEAADLL